MSLLNLPMPFYVGSDVWALLEVIPYLQIAKEPAASRWLQKMHRDGQELGPVLRQFPGVRYAPLEMHYVLAKALTATDEKLISDLTSFFSWPGVVYAALLAAFRPQRQYASYLLSARQGVPHNQWLVDLALGEIEGEERVQPSQLQGLVRAIRETLPAYPRDGIRLREWPVGEGLVELKAARDALAVTYRTCGADRALAELKRSAWSAFLAA